MWMRYDELALIQLTISLKIGHIYIKCGMVG